MEGRLQTGGAAATDSDNINRFRAIKRQLFELLRESAGRGIAEAITDIGNGQIAFLEQLVAPRLAHLFTQFIDTRPWLHNDFLQIFVTGTLLYWVALPLTCMSLRKRPSTRLGCR